MYYRLTLLITILFILTGCSENIRNPRLVQISETVSESPEEALCCLDSINYETLSTDDKYFYDFLSLKAKDKAYITHTSDSAYVRILKYYSKKNNDRLFPEILYYGGRVYSDLGDYPTALTFFQRALDYLPANIENINLRGVALSQTARLLNSLRLYKEAVPYLVESIEIDKQLNDSVNEVYDIQLLGSVYLRAHDYLSAQEYFRTALTKCLNLPEYHRAKSSMYLAQVMYRMGQIDSAMVYIRDTPYLVKPIARNSALATAADIYHTAGIHDTAYLYAHELICSNDNLNKATGYHILLSPELQHLLPPDSVHTFLSEYLALLETYYNENENQLALYQSSLHNYQLHDREREKSERSNSKLRQWLLAFSILVLVMCIFILFQKNKDANNRLKLHAALENIEKLKIEIKKQERFNRVEEDNNKSNPQDVLPSSKKETTNELREKLRKQLYELYSNNCGKDTISQEIIESDVYKQLESLISEGKEIKEDGSLWLDIEALVLKCSPNFKSNLQLLVGGKLNSYDLHTSLLIKCGFQPTQMTILLNRSKGAISSRRESLCYRVFDEKLGTKVIDGIIRLL